MKAWKKVALAVPVVVLLAVCAVAVKFYALSPSSRPAAALTATSTPETIARGKYLFESALVCVVCHSTIDESQPGTPVDHNTYAKGRTFDAANQLPGKIRGRNLTPDPTVGIGSWSDGEIVRAIREGISRDGRPLFPMMPYRSYRETLSDADALTIVAYLRSLPPSSHDPGATSISFPVSMFIRAVPAPVTTPAVIPGAADAVAHGRWLLKAASCNQCHDSADAQHRPIAGRELGGGLALPYVNGVAVAPNISSDPTSGIGSYTDEELMRVLDEGKGKSGRLLFMMPWTQYRTMTVEDKRAMIAALRASKPVSGAGPATRL